MARIQIMKDCFLFKKFIFAFWKANSGRTMKSGLQGVRLRCKKAVFSYPVRNNKSPNCSRWDGEIELTFMK